MRVLFYYRGIESLGVGYLMSNLKQHGHQVDLIFDPGFDDNLYLKFKSLRWLNRYGELLDRAKAFNPDLVAISSLTNLYPFAREMAHMLKEKLGAPVVFGGHHAQAVPEYVLANPDVDFVCTGEGEFPLLELVDRMQRGEDLHTIPGIWAKKDGEIIRTEMAPLVGDLDTLPFSEKDLWAEYGALNTSLEIITGRGCPFQCTFCDIHYQREIFKGAGEFLRKRSVANVIEEFKTNVRKFDPRTVVVHDDNFTTNPKWVEEFCEAYRKEVNLPWYCFGYPTTINEKIVKAMKAANCMTILMGVDSGDADLRRQMKRPMSDEVLLKAANTIMNGGVGLHVSCMFGMPKETAEQMWKTVRIIDEMRPHQASGFIFYPFPKTKMYQAAVEQGYLSPEGEEMVRQGCSGYHHDSLLDHPDKELAVTISKLLPIFNRVPDFLRPAISWIMARRQRRLASLIYMLTFPIVFPFLGIDAMRVTGRMAWRAVTLPLRRRRRASEPPSGQAPGPRPAETRTAA
jgi:radical SAM superfamily enzyme YgiQ (UPF0313 family)